MTVCYTIQFSQTLAHYASKVKIKYILMLKTGNNDPIKFPPSKIEIAVGIARSPVGVSFLLSGVLNATRTGTSTKTAAEI